MADINFPKCPVCKKEVLLPFSIMQIAGVRLAEKTYGTWICSNCGFFLSTGDTRGINSKKDVKAGFSVDLQKQVEDLRKKHYRKMQE